jgi:hypothetical protein
MRPRLYVIAALAVLVAGCAAGDNPLAGTPGVRGVAGFWLGLWHGMICPIAFVVSLFNSHVAIYEVHNSGGWYDAGFILGAGAWGILGRGRGSEQRSSQVT